MSVSRVLLVEDDDVVAGFIEYLLTDHGLEVVRTADAEAGWAELGSGGAGFGAILLARQSPGMDGMTLLRQIKDKPALRDIPVIMETSEDSVDSIREGLAAGAYYYLTEPMQPELLLAVVDAALAQYRQWVEARAGVHEAESALLSLEYGVFRCRTLTESRDLASGLARGCLDPKRVVPGLQELLTNAVEHGNLGISDADKTHLVLENPWSQEVERRLAQPGYLARTVTVILARQAGDITLTIRDEGDGFDWRKYLDFEPERAFDPHGPGIAMARLMSFDAIEYQGNGNTVVLKIAQSAAAESA